MYVSLSKLSKEQSPAGELALFLLGKNVNPKSETVKKIVDTFKMSFDVFRTDKEVAKMLSLRERGRDEGLIEGIPKGAAIGMARMLDLINKGYSPEEAFYMVSEDGEALVEAYLSE